MLIARFAFATDRIELVDEDDRGRLLPRRREQFSNSPRSDPDIHCEPRATDNVSTVSLCCQSSVLFVRTRMTGLTFVEFTAARREESNSSFARDRSREQSLSGSGRSSQEDAARQPPTQFLKLFRVLEELDNLVQFVLRLFDAVHVLESCAPTGRI